MEATPSYGSSYRWVGCISHCTRIWVGEEGSNVRFAPGRGRSNINGSTQIGRPSFAYPIGTDKNSNAIDTYCYRRGKLLDIYRKQKIIPTFDTIPDGMEHVSRITQGGSAEPLAFVAPDAEEEAVLGEIWKGKVTGGGALPNSFREKNGESNNNITGEAVSTNGALLEPSDGGAQVGRSGRKKGKKGRHIDPALLGFKVSSNRIMMGEIQRLED